jgi:hypothetical protein
MTDTQVGGLAREALVAGTGEVRLGGLARETLVSGQLVDLAVVIAAKSSVTEALSFLLPLAGSITAESSLGAPLTSVIGPPPVPLAGLITATSSLNAPLLSAIAPPPVLAGLITATSSLRAPLTVILPLAGLITATSSLNAPLTSAIVPPPVLAGLITATSSLRTLLTVILPAALHPGAGITAQSAASGVLTLGKAPFAIRIVGAGPPLRPTMAVFEIPTRPGQPQHQTISLAGVRYNLDLYWDVPAGLWMLNIADRNNVTILNGLPLVTGVDLLEQYQYLGIGGALVVQSDFDWRTTPTFDNLGRYGHFYFIPTPPPVQPGITIPQAPQSRTRAGTGITLPEPARPSMDD